MQTKTRVFAIEHCKYDISYASAFGDIVYLFHGDMRRPSLFQRDMDTAIVQQLEANEFDPATDCVLIAGAIPGIAAMCGVLGAVFGEFNGLVFNARTREYELRVMGLSFATTQE